MGLFSNLFGGKNDKAKYFRKLENIFGVQEIKGLEAVSDARINEIYEEVKNALHSIASKKNESIPESVIDALVRDLLINEVHGQYEQQFNNMKDMYTKYEIRSLFVKGRIYSWISKKRVNVKRNELKDVHDHICCHKFF